MYDWAKNKIVATASGGEAKIMDLEWSPSASSFTAVGLGSGGAKGTTVKFWSVLGNDLVGKKAAYAGRGSVQPMLSICYGGSGDIVLTGGAGGAIHEWGNGNKLLRVVPAHKGAVLTPVRGPSATYSGGEDGRVKMWDAKLALLKTFEIPGGAHTVPPPICGLALPSQGAAAGAHGGDHLLVATRRAEVFKMQKDGRCQVCSGATRVPLIVDR